MRALVTGAAGFLGSHLARALVTRGGVEGVRVLVRRATSELESLGVDIVLGDIRDADTTARACAGIDTVFHAAAKAGGWGPDAEFDSINVGGTRNIIAACRAVGVSRLVYTSSPSVVHADRDVEGENESLPYPMRYLAAYPRTKAVAERAVLAARSSQLRTIALRPHFIWGPGDRHLLPRLIERSRAGRLRRIGSRDPKTDTIYIDNCVDAHLLAADSLTRSDIASGRAYFISDDAPLGVFTMADRMLAAAGAPPSGRPIPAPVAYSIAGILEAAHALLGIEREPLLTRFAVSVLTHAQWYDISAAKRDLGYAPKVSIEEGLRRLAESFETTAA